jgi:hypothetical protein
VKNPKNMANGLYYNSSLFLLQKKLWRNLNMKNGLGLTNIGLKVI